MTKSKGFSLIEIIIVVVVVAVLGLITWRIYDTQMADQSDGKKTIDAQNTDADVAKQDKKQTDPNQGYVVIKEWDARFEPVEGLEGVEYAKRDLVGLAGVEFPSGTENIVITTNQLAKLSQNCAADAESHTALGTLYRSPASWASDNLLLHELDGYFYYFAGPQSVCGTPADAELFSASSMRLTESLPSLESAQ